MPTWNSPGFTLGGCVSVRASTLISAVHAAGLMDGDAPSRKIHAFIQKHTDQREQDRRPAMS